MQHRTTDVGNSLTFAAGSDPSSRNAQSVYFSAVLTNGKCSLVLFRKRVSEAVILSCTPDPAWPTTQKGRWTFHIAARPLGEIKEVARTPVITLSEPYLLTIPKGPIADAVFSPDWWPTRSSLVMAKFYLQPGMLPKAKPK